MRILRWVFFGIGVIVFSVMGIVYLLGSSTASDFSGRAQAVIARPSQDVWAVLSDPTKTPAWSPSVKKVEPAGENTWKFQGAEGKTETFATMRYTLLEPGRQLRTEMVESPQPVNGTWTFTLTPQGPSTNVTVDVKMNVSSPWLRFGMRYLADISKIEQEQLDLLKKHLEKP